MKWHVIDCCTRMEPRQRQTTSAFRNNNRQNIFYRNWSTDNQPKGIVIVIHGLNSHSGYYQNFAFELNESNYEVYAVDLRGRGQSDGERYYISEFDEIIADIDLLLNIAKSAHADAPLFLFGHSAGGVFASVFAVHHQAELCGLISESFAFQLPAPRFAQATMKLLAYLIPHTRLVKLNNEYFSRDKVILNTMNNDPLLINEKQPAKTMQQLFLAAEYLKNKMHEIKLPLLVLHGTADKATKPSGSEYFVEHASSADKQLKLYEGYYHDLINDKYNGIVIKDIIHWLNQRV